VTTNVAGEARTFTLETSLTPKTNVLERELIDRTERGTPAQTANFNELATLFAAILTPHRLRIDFPPQDGEQAQPYLDRLKLLPDALLAGIKTVEDKLNARKDLWNSVAVAEVMRGRAESLRQRVATLIATGKTAAQLREEAGLPVEIAAAWLKGKEMPQLVAAGATVSDWKEFDVDDLNKGPGTLLAVWDLATEKEISALRDADVSPAGKKKGRLVRILARRILGATNRMVLKVVDGRARLVKGEDGKPLAVVDTPVKLPGWLEEVIA
jgi:hypothetical protein